MYELSRKQFVFFFVFSDYGRVLCTKRGSKLNQRGLKAQ